MIVKIARLSFYLLLMFCLSCGDNNPAEPGNVDYRQEMRNFVMSISSYAKDKNDRFIIIPQNGQELITDNGEGDGILQTEYINSIDATGRESMFYGYYSDDEETPEEDKQHLLYLCLLCEQFGVEVLSTDYCSTQSKMDESYKLNKKNGFISFAADKRELNNIPNYPQVPFNQNSNDITLISDAENFLYLINSENYISKSNFVNAVSQTNYDLIIMDLYHNENGFTKEEISLLKTKNNGGKRLVVCYMSIGEAEDYRYYWPQKWKTNKPTWLETENPNWEGNYKVQYWNSEWQKIIYGSDTSYLDKIINSGFDGVYLDIIDGFEYFEER